MGPLGRPAGIRTPNSLQEHLAVDRYDGFKLTPAVRPALGLPIIPRQAYRIGSFVDEPTSSEIPMIAASVSEEQLFDVFLELIGGLSDVVDVILDSHHAQRASGDESDEYLREHIDRPILESYCIDYREILTDDGCLGIAIVDPRGPSEIQFDDHKTFIIYSKRLRPFIDVFESHGVRRDDALKLISEGEHLHSTSEDYLTPFQSLRYAISAEPYNSGWSS